MRVHTPGPKISNICHCTNGKIEAPKAPRSSAEGARIEAPKAPRGVGCGEGVSPFPSGRGLGRGLCPLPRKFFDFGSQNGELSCILMVYFRVQMLVLHTKTSVP